MYHTIKAAIFAHAKNTLKACQNIRRKHDDVQLIDSIQNTISDPVTIHEFSMLAGNLQRVESSEPYSVGFRPVNDEDQPFYRYWSKVLSYGSLVLSIAFGIILFRPSNWVVIQHPISPTYVENWIMLGCLVLLQCFIVVRTYSATRATLKAQNPVPIHAPKGLRVAFATTRAPGEPVSMVETTLKAAKKIRYPAGSVDVWLLDETGDLELLKLCRELNVGYFSRSGVSHWNMEKRRKSLHERAVDLLRWSLPPYAQPPAASTIEEPPSYNPFFAAKTKHGNYNAWFAQLEQSELRYDILAGVDTDQVPQSNYLTRVLGYFNDINVAFVVGPQVYGNFAPGLSGLVARWAESQASFFQSTIQRAGNAATAAMFVGTNYAVRMDAIRQIGGFQPCITEDMATGLAIHAERNPYTGVHWKSVYTPDVLAVGEGPDFWGPYFTQQWRWAAGTFDTWKRMVWRKLFKLPPRSLLHYLLILSFYPMAALTWLLAIVSSSVYLLTGGTAINAPWGQFLSLYSLAAVMQLSLYFWNRRYNVSPHETAGSYGISGMALTSLAAPIYFSAFFGVLIGKRTKFVVTQKGIGSNPDGLRTFKVQLLWAILESAIMVFGILHGRDHPALLVWTGVILVPCLLPVILGMSLVLRSRPIRLPKLLPHFHVRPAPETTNA